MAIVPAIARKIAVSAIMGGRFDPCVATIPISKQPNSVKRSINRSMIKLLVAVVLLLPSAAGNTSALTTSPIRSGKILFKAMEPRKGAEHLRHCVAATEACSRIDQRQILSAYPLLRDALPQAN